MSNNSEKLALFLRETTNWRWDEFVKGEHDPSFTTNQSIVFALIRSCALESLSAIKMSINRLDGKLKTPIKVEYPKFFYLYPYADPQKLAQTYAKPDDPVLLEQAKAIVQMEVLPGATVVEQETSSDAKPERDLPSMSLRETLTEMADCPRELPQQIIDLALQTEMWLRDEAPQPQEIPLVKSVVVAHLLIMAQKRNMDAMTEVFDQIDGKLVETIQIVGEDVYMTMYQTEAPEGAYLNEDGVLQIEAMQPQQIWTEQLAKGMGNL